MKNTKGIRGGYEACTNLKASWREDGVGLWVHMPPRGENAFLAACVLRPVLCFIQAEHFEKKNIGI